MNCDLSSVDATIGSGAVAGEPGATRRPRRLRSRGSGLPATRHLEMMLYGVLAIGCTCVAVAALAPIAALALLAQTKYGFVIDAEAQAAILIVLNIILRAITKAPIGA